MEIQTARGVKDAPAQELIVRNKLVSDLKKIFERYGFNPLETPIIERLDVLNAKFGAGDTSDVAKEIFRFKDQGSRDLGLRFDLTLPVCRHIAMNPTMKMPFKRYEIGRVYRDGPIKLGRSREFYQCDVDIIGSKKMISDAECIKLALDAFKKLGLNAYIEVNNRKLLNGMFEYAGIGVAKREDSIIIVDKLKKIGAIKVAAELVALGVRESAVEKLMTLFAVLNLEGDLFENIREFKKVIASDVGKQGIEELKELFALLSKEDLENVKFNPTLARGLSYYTGTVFEGFLRDSPITSSICGGGRYDELIKSLLGSKENVPAVGISFGLVPIMEAVKLTNKEMKKTVTDVFIIPIGNVTAESFNIASELRSAGVNTSIDLMSRAISKNLNFANSEKIPFVLFVGENELKDKKLKLRDMTSGKETLISLENIGKEVKKLV